MTSNSTAGRSIRSRDLHSWLHLFSGPLIWLLHFLVSYMTAAIWCAHPVRGSFVDVRVAILAYTLIALTLLVLVIRRGLRRCGPLSVLPWQDAATPRHRRRFMAYTTILLAGLAIMAVLFTALAALLIGHCQ